jgi:hypothetical protein
MRRKFKTFRQFIEEDVVKTYYIQLDPFTDEDEMQEPLTEMMAFCLFHSARGQGVLLTARPFESEFSESVRR